MKLQLLSLVLSSLFFIPSTYGGAGDTLKVTSHDDVVIKTEPSVGHTDYAEWIEIPDSINIRKVLATLTFECAPGLRCGEWDYLNYIYIGRVGGKSGQDLNYEIARYITPYGFYWHSQDNWKHSWTMDLTDWAVLLQDSVEIIYRHTGYENNTDRGWKINLDFEIIEGTPVRKPINVTPMWNGRFQYGNPQNPIEDQLSQMEVDLQPNTSSASLYLLQTGHGADPDQQCGEFCSKERTVLKDGNMVNKRDIWRSCGNISLYPQAGTWLLDRANWCPGDVVFPDRYHFNELNGGSTHTFDVNMENYTASSEFGNYVFSSYLFEYEEIASENDVGLSQIIAPSTEKEHLRFNPRCNQAIIEIKNNGSKQLTSVEIEYGIEGSMATYSWSGDLAFGESEEVTLFGSPDWNIRNKSTFKVQLSSPNGTEDEYPHDNIATSHIKPVEVMPAEFVIKFRSTKAGNETRYRIVDGESGEVVLERKEFYPTTTIEDSITLEEDKCYILQVIDDGAPISGGIDFNADGLEFWYWDALASSTPQYTQYIDNQNGFFKIYSAETPLLLKNLTATKNFKNASINGGDFGKTLQFSFITEKTTATKNVITSSDLSVYPNPSSGKLNIDLYDLDFRPHTLTIKSISGKIISRQKIDGMKKLLNTQLTDIVSGMYIIQLQSDRQVIRKKVVIHR